MAVSSTQGPQAPKLPELLERDPYLAPFERDFQRRYRPRHGGGLDLRDKLRAGGRWPPASGGAGSGGGRWLHPSPRRWAVPAPARLRFRPRRGQFDSRRSNGGGASRDGQGTLRGYPQAIQAAGLSRPLWPLWRPQRGFWHLARSPCYCLKAVALFHAA